MTTPLSTLSDELHGRAAGLSGQALVSLLYADLRDRWTAGDRIAVERYREAFPALAGQPQELLDLIYGEYRLRKQLGPPPSAE